jgi:hypothetical protein
LELHKKLLNINIDINEVELNRLSYLAEPKKSKKKLFEKDKEKDVDHEKLEKLNSFAMQKEKLISYRNLKSQDQNKTLTSPRNNSLKVEKPRGDSKIQEKTVKENRKSSIKKWFESGQETTEGPPRYIWKKSSYSSIGASTNSINTGSNITVGLKKSTSNGELNKLLNNINDLLFDAINKNNLNQIKKLLSENPNFDINEPKRIFGLVWNDSLKRYSNGVRYFGDMNIWKSKYGEKKHGDEIHWTPIMLVIGVNRIELFDFFLESNAKLNIKDKLGDTAIDFLKLLKRDLMEEHFNNFEEKLIQKSKNNIQIKINDEVNNKIGIKINESIELKEVETDSESDSVDVLKEKRFKLKKKVIFNDIYPNIVLISKDEQSIQFHKNILKCLKIELNNIDLFKKYQKVIFH